MLRNNIRQLYKHSFFYSIGWAANVLSGIVMLPVYSKYLSRADYGAIDLVQQSNSLMKILFLAGLTAAMSKFFHEAQSERERSLTMSSGVITIVFLGLIASAICLLLNRQISQYIFGSPDYKNYINLGAFTLFLEISFMGLACQYYVAKESLMFVKLNLTKLTVGIFANLLFIVYFNKGAIGMLIGSLISYIPVALIAGRRFYQAYGVSIDVPVLKKMFKFGFPIMPATFLAAILHNADRFLLRSFGSLDQVGLLTMGLNFPSMLNSVLLTSFNSIWAGATMFQINQQSNSDYQTGKIATYFMTAYCCAQTALGIYSTSIMDILVDHKFNSSHVVIPIACMGYCFHASYTFLTVGAFTKNKMSIMIYAYAVPVILKVVLSCLLIKKFGFLASAWIICASYLLFSIMCFVLFRNINTAKFEYSRLGSLLVSSSLALVGAFLLPVEGLVLRILCQTVIVLLLATFLWWGPFLSKDERSQINKEIRVLMDRFVPRLLHYFSG